MAYGVLPKPGTKFGPCEQPCQHKDCAETRRQAESICRYCGKPIDYEVAFNAEGKVFVHNACLIEANEK